MKRHLVMCCMIAYCVCCAHLIGCGGGGAEIKQTTTNTSLGQELQDLDTAYQKKIITEKEYKNAKEKLLKKYAK
ncbi:MAG: hypothetical protein DCC43_09535 [Candidatus Brocadia sp.]|jgi:hypothetical protein|uniref:SHOCT domain-containing protein n=1 Tax=Candidatus Brocadia fulgida TaxID=380242 RepID=A0A0M2UXM0_9BACT|nr:MAG: hypothetical protein BROFUL_02063 [Candidatus Brocadia fulgida]MCC6326326.1 hypothetical protein [Candidatus Brocadia sp.]MDG5995354.1 hypothetical protein [Candidatus Brocadia sp.]RIJ98570.1 MAG: hypothetical protein DCC43_09535 [Candidatus Brocadia sp.]UJS19620.1 MAG: DMAP1-binding domain-containing protein [Candidatus Brocadia sp.]